MSAKFDHYLVFYYVAKEGNVSRAAERLYISQPSISKTVQKLENELGCRLLERTNRGVRLTLDGQYLFEEIAPHCEALLHTSDTFSRRRREDSGVVRLASNSDVSWYAINDCINRFREEHAEVQFTNANVDSKLMEKTLRDGVVDLGFVLTPNVPAHLLGSPSYTPQLLRDPKLRTEYLGSYEDVAVAGSGKLEYLRMAQRVLSGEELQKVPLILSIAGDYYAKLLGRTGAQSKGDIAVRDIKTRIEMAKMNMGVAFLPRMCVEKELDNGWLVELDIQSLAMMTRDLYVLASRERELDIKARTFMDFAIATLSKEK